MPYTGPSLDDLIERVREAIVVWLESAGGPFRELLFISIQPITVADEQRSTALRKAALKGTDCSFIDCHAIGPERRPPLAIRRS